MTVNVADNFVLAMIMTVAGLILAMIMTVTGRILVMIMTAARLILAMIMMQYFYLLLTILYRQFSLLGWMMEHLLFGSSISKEDGMVRHAIRVLSIRACDGALRGGGQNVPLGLRPPKIMVLVCTP